MWIKWNIWHFMVKLVPSLSLALAPSHDQAVLWRDYIVCDSQFAYSCDGARARGIG